jgi:MscS family membrane protein
MSRGAASQAATLLLWLAASASGQVPSPPASPVASASPAAAPDLDIAPDSPRASMTEFFALANQGRYAEAAAYLDLSPDQQKEAAEYARKLKAVLDRYLWVDLESLSARPEGDGKDAQPPLVDFLGVIPVDDRKEPVRIIRRSTPNGVRWLFSRNTVSRVDGWYAQIDDQWIRGHLPPSLLRFGPHRLLLWQWLALPVIGLAAWYAGRLLSWAARRTTKPITSRAGPWAEGLLKGMRVPIALAFAVAVAFLLTRFLGLNPSGEEFVTSLLSAAATLSVFGALYTAIGAFGERARAAHWYSANASARSGFALAERAGKVGVAVLGVVAVLVQLGYPAASALAALGIGGIALALAAQKTVENLFGSVSLAVDQTIRIGDLVQVENVLGRVEEIGLRATRLRTPDRTLVTIPNGVLANLRIESLTARDRMRFAASLGLQYGASATQVEKVLSGVEKLLLSHPQRWPDNVVVSLRQLGPASIDLEVVAWFTVTPDDFPKLRAALLLDIMRVVEQAGCAFAAPQQPQVVRGS